MKYKRLSSEELKHLEKEFVNFLASAQITGPDWEKMKANEIEKAEELLDVFSDLVFEKVMSKIKYLEYRDEKTFNVYSCDAEKIVLVGLRVKENSSLDFTAADVFTQWNDSHTSAVNVIKNEKKYSKERGVEVFELLQTGCFITDDRLFKILNGMM
jgi:hypothetical protein